MIMKKTAVIYWSGTGNTEAMAQAVLAGMQEAGADAALYTTAEVTPALFGDLTGVAFGCPAMGAEVLEEMDFQPMWDEAKGFLGGKNVALFGSYGWGDGEWMRNWAESCQGAGAALVSEGVICNGAPDDSAEAECRALGQALA